ncbi:hypothetical protein PsorP6_009561 [Peronosclerospora sorghi]|uniref:Uncharacterized protein n=1 Tax=Peronosclerospora sorghi TaxID=230839 RepID=A0ACC0VY59_9STRA|nr:hypothetical protein PsorP6_009561 [Peronosclerospora sorghi]
MLVKTIVNDIPKRNKSCHRCGECGHFKAQGTAVIDGVLGPGVVGNGNDVKDNNNSVPGRCQQRSNFLKVKKGKGTEVDFFLDDVLYVEDAEGGLPSMSCALSSHNKTDKNKLSVCQNIGFWHLKQTLVLRMLRVGKKFLAYL